MTDAKSKKSKPKSEPLAPTPNQNEQSSRSGHEDFSKKSAFKPSGFNKFATKGFNNQRFRTQHKG